MTGKGNFSKDLSQITLMLPSGKGLPVVEYLHSKGHDMTNLNYARGNFVGGPAKKNGDLIETEQEVVSVIVSGKEADEVFAELYEFADLDQPAGGFMYCESLDFGSLYEVPKVS